jgi:hypothetical protein
MKTFTLLAVTGGLFFNSLCLNNSDAKKHKAYSKVNAKHCVKKCCKNMKTTKEAAFNISKAV